MSFLRKPSDRTPTSTSTPFSTFILPSIPFRRRSRQSSTDSYISTFSSSASSSSPSSSFFSSSSPAATATATATAIAPTSPITLPDLDTPNFTPPPDDKFLSGHTSHLRCGRCSTDLCLTSQIISKGFTGRHGRAYLVQGPPCPSPSQPRTRPNIHSYSPTLPNTYQNKAVPRLLVTGQHTVSDISCSVCGSVLGWKYVEAAEESQKYKVGKFILETKMIRGCVDWEHGDEEVCEYDQQDAAATAGGFGFGFGFGSVDEISRSSAAAATDADEQVLIEFDSQDEDECEDLFAGVWSPELALRRRRARTFGRRRIGGTNGLGIGNQQN